LGVTLSEKWFEEVFKGAKKEFPKEFNPEICKSYEIEFLENEPRKVAISKTRYAGVIEIHVNGERRSLFISRQYLGQKIVELQKKHRKLMGIRIKLHLLPKVKKYYEYEIEEIDD